MKKNYLTLFLSFYFFVAYSQYDCASIVSITGGEITIPASDDPSYYVKFTMPVTPKKLVMSSDREFDFNYRTWSCESISMFTYTDDRREFLDLEPQQEIFFRFVPHPDYTQTIALNAVDFAVGDICETAEVIDEGIHSFKSSPDIYNYYYKVTLPDYENARIYINYPESPSTNIIFRGTCEDLISWDGIQSNTTDEYVTGFDAGETIYIVFRTPWNETNEFEWELKIVPPQTGDSCQDPDFSATEGENILPETRHTVFWYKYQIPEDADKKKMLITAPDSTVIKLVLYDECLSNTDFYNLKGVGSLEHLEITPGEILYIKLSDYNPEDFKWRLDFVDLLPGERCDVAIELDKGENYKDENLPWFKFTPEENGYYEISSMGFTNVDTDLTVSTSCRYGYYASNDDYGDSYQSYLKVYLEAGQEYFFLWEDTYSDEAFTFSFYEESDHKIEFEEILPIRLDEVSFRLNANSSLNKEVQFRSSDESVATIEGQDVIVHKAGNCEITAFYNAEEPHAIEISRELNVLRGYQFFTYDSIGYKHINSEPFVLGGSLNSHLEFDYSIMGPASMSGDSITLSGEAGMVKIMIVNEGNDNFYPLRDSVVFTVDNPCLTVNLKIEKLSDAQCYDSDDAAVLVEVEGGKEPYTYILNQDTVDLFKLVNLSKGRYELTVQDAYDCSETLQFLIDSPDSIQVSPDILNSTVSEGNGEINLIITGGTGIYEVLWDNQFSGSKITNLSVGSYTATITDSNGCTVEQTYQINGVGNITSNKNELSQKFRIYPNPVSEVLNLELNGNYDNIRLALYDAWGRFLRPIEIERQVNQIDLSALNAGLYIIKSEELSGQLKFIKKD